MEHTCSALKAHSDKNASCRECQRQSTIECTCPDWWFPSDRREQCKKLAHNFGGILAHHTSCAKR